MSNHLARSSGQLIRYGNVKRLDKPTERNRSRVKVEMAINNKLSYSSSSSFVYSPAPLLRSQGPRWRYSKEMNRPLLRRGSVFRCQLFFAYTSGGRKKTAASPTRLQLKDVRLFSASSLIFETGTEPLQRYSPGCILAKCRERAHQPSKQ